MAPLTPEDAKERRAYILNRARQLAGTGKYADHRAIGWELSEVGYPGARDILGRREIRDELDELCRRAQ